MQAPLQPPTDGKLPVPLKDIEEITIGIAAKNLDPTMLSADFLKFSGIVPNEWELAKQPVQSPRGSQVSFQNGVNVVAQPGNVSFIEAIANKDLKQLQFSRVAQKYVQKLPLAEYQAVSISPKIIVPFPEDQDGGKKFIRERLIAAGPWLDFGNTSPQAALNLFYQLEKCQFALNINPARLQQPNQTVISGVLFAGNFTYNLAQIGADERIERLIQTINNWDQDLTIFRELIYEKFLQKAIPQTESLFNV
jgi:hypothetical protein